MLLLWCPAAVLGSPTRPAVAPLAGVASASRAGQPRAAAAVVAPPLALDPLLSPPPPPLPVLARKRRAVGSAEGGVPATPSAQLQHVLPLVNKGAVAGEHMLHGPNIFRGISPDGKIMTALPLLGQAEELEARLLCLCSFRPPPYRPAPAASQLIRQAWFFVAASDARREVLRAASTDAPDEAGVNHELLLQHMRERAARPVKPCKGSRSAGGEASSMSELCSQLPKTLSDTEFRLMEALGRGAYNKLFLHNQGLIYHEVHQLFPNWRTATVMEKADLLQEGAQGLLRAIRLFDPCRAVRFSTYACWHVRSYILRAVRDKLHVVRLPQVLQQDMVQIRKARYRYAVENQGHPPSPRDLADTLQWPTSRVERALEGLSSASSVSLDDSVGGAAQAVGDARQPLLNRVPSARHGSAASENALYQQQLRTTLSQAMRERDPRRVQLIRLRYGMEDGKEWSYPQLGARFNMTASAVKGMVHQELKFLRRERRQVLQHFI